MRTAPPGTLLKPQRPGRSTLITSVQSRRLADTLHDLIIIAYERSTNRRSSSLILVKSEYASAVQNGAKYSMRLNVLVKEADLDDTIPLTVTFTVDSEDVDPCWAH